MMPNKQETIQSQQKRLHKAKWVVFGGTSMLVLLIIVFNYLFFDMPLNKGIVNGLAGVGITYLMVTLAFNYVGRLRLQLYEALESQKATEAELILHGLALESAANAIVMTDKDGRITWINPAFAQLTGYMPDEIIGQYPSVLKSGQHDNIFYVQMWQTILAGQVWQGEIINRHKDGRLYSEEQTITPVLDEQGQVSRFIAIKQDITQRKQAEKAQRQYAERLQALRGIEQAILAAQSPQEIAQATLERVRQLVPCFRASVALFDFEINQGQVLAVQTNLDTRITAGQTLPLESFNLNERVRMGQIHLVNDVNEKSFQSTIVQDLRLEGLRSLVNAPLMVQGQLIGMLNLGADKPASFTPSDIEIIREVADSLAVTIQHAHLYEAEQTARIQLEAQAVELRERERYLALLNDITRAALETADFQTTLQIFADRLGDLIKADGCYITLWDEARQKPVAGAAYGPMQDRYRYQTSEPGEATITESVLNAGHPLVAEDVFNSSYLSPRIAALYPTRSMLALPLIVGPWKLGAALVAFEETHQFTNEEIERCKQGAGQIALALAKANLLKTEREQRDLAEALREAGSALGSSLDLDVVLDRVMEQIGRVVPFDSACLMMVDKGFVYFSRIRGYDQFSDQTLNALQNLSFEIAATPNLRRVFETQQPVIITDITTDPEWIQTPTSAHIRAWIGAPVIVEKEVVAIFSLDNQTPGFYQPNHAQILKTFATQVALSFHNAQLFEQASRRARELDLLNHIIATAADAESATDLLIHSCAELASFFAVSQVVAAVSDEKRTKVTIVAEYLDPDLPSLLETEVPILGNPVLENMFHSGVLVTLKDVSGLPLLPEMEAVLTRRGISSVLMVPVPLRDKVVAALGIHSRETRQFTQAEIRLAQTVGEEVGRALETVRLHEQLRAYAIELEQRVAERTRELAEANVQLQTLDRMKSKFVSDVSHELRTPITNLGMYLDLLEHGRADKKEHYVNVLQRETTRISQLVQDILDLSRLEESQNEGMAFEQVDLNQIVEQVVTAQVPKAQEAGLALLFESKADLPMILGAPRQLAQVVTNLLANAINYTPEGQITVTTYHRDGEVCLKVQDTGIGIDAVDMPHLFERFYRGKRVAQLGVPGTGLGLGIVKEIVDLHGGRAEATSQPERGSIFYIWLRVIPDNG